jgi:hypothetical protein
MSVRSRPFGLRLTSDSMSPGDAAAVAASLPPCLSCLQAGFIPPTATSSNDGNRPSSGPSTTTSLTSFRPCAMMSITRQSIFRPPIPEQHYRPDRYVVRERPSADALTHALRLLKRDWHTIAGSELASVCEPDSFTGAKARRLLVTVFRKHTPPWGTWSSLPAGPQRETFTALRKRINDAITPVYVDHVDFHVRTNAA